MFGQERNPFLSWYIRKYILLSLYIIYLLLFVSLAVSTLCHLTA
nr:MAG TPA: hypothetical protein [Caudoviricetes sp.]